jgi:NAD(P)-dependent dehydrogenase (short-subunit alcohol dehydrogenase family)
MNDIDLRDRTAVVTGGASGLGLATARRMVQSGARVCLWDTNGSAFDAIRAELPDIATHAVDVTDKSAVQIATDETVKQLGQIDILVNSAGMEGIRSATSAYPVDKWRRTIDLNVTGTFLPCRAVIPVMEAHDYGRIVNISSVAGKEGNAFAAAYSSAKAAVIGFTKSVGKELAKTNIRINCVTPAVVETELYLRLGEERQQASLSKVPMGRPGRPDEIAALVCWLASEDCSFSTGAIFDLSGGRATY